MRKLDTNTILGIALSFLLWYVVFITDILWSFWFRVTLASLILMIYAQGQEKNESDIQLKKREIAIGAISGLGLYLLFYMGFNIFRPLLEGGASNVYVYRSELPLIIPSSLLLITSYCEEYFWRRYVQREVISIQGKYGIITTSLLYAAIHIPTFNLPLIVAALIAGLFWGLLYSKTGSFWFVVFSHIVWTELIFIFAPLS